MEPEYLVEIPSLLPPPHLGAKEGGGPEKSAPSCLFSQGGGHSLLEAILSSGLHFLSIPSSSSATREPSKPEPREKAEEPSPRGAPPPAPTSHVLSEAVSRREPEESDCSRFLRNKSRPESQLCPNIS